jgi:alkylated DNA nucleotide flippase Atl1
MPNDSEVIRVVQQIMASTGLSYGQVAAAMDGSPSTVRFAIETQRLPERSDARIKFVRFADRSREAKSRADVRFI